MRISALAAGFFWLILSGSLPAALAVPAPDRSTPEAATSAFSFERSVFLLAEQALNAGNETSFRASRQILEGYPLQPYLDYRQLARNLSAADPEGIARFLEHHDDGPLARMLRNHYLNHLAKERDWPAFLRFAEYGGALSTELSCFRLQALHHTGRPQQALEAVEPIWLHGRSQPDACDPVLERWRAAGRLTPELGWQRLELAIEAGQTGLARYLRRYLSASDRVWADRWLDLEANPERVTRAGFTAAEHPAAGPMLERALLSRIRSAPEDAIATWRRDSATLGLSTEAQHRLLHALALRLAVRGRPETLPFMGGLPEAVFDDQLRQWQLRAALRDQDWNTVRHAVEGMTAATQNQATWQYWLGRALEQLGHEGSAQAAYREAAQHRNFHGFLAADRVGQPYRIAHRPLSVPAAVQAQVDAIPAMARMRELILLERFTEARREWSHLIDSLSNPEKEAAARRFADWGWHDRAIFTAARAQSWDDIDLRFPLAFAEPILEGAQAHKVDPAWAMAIARQESAFLHDVRSSAGALGIMQILPATGRSVATAAGVQIRNDRDILDPRTNARLGTHYLRRNLDGFGGHTMLSTAAYNAGASRVRSWLPKNGEMDPDIWAELIPFHETRDYIQRVFAYRILYALRLDQTPPALQSLLFPVTSVDQLAQARERHLWQLGANGTTQAALGAFCDAPGYTQVSCRDAETEIQTPN